jgi:hypothetical protein
MPFWTDYPEDKNKKPALTDKRRQDIRFFIKLDAEKKKDRQFWREYGYDNTGKRVFRYYQKSNTDFVGYRNITKEEYLALKNITRAAAVVHADTEAMNIPDPLLTNRKKLRVCNEFDRHTYCSPDKASNFKHINFNTGKAKYVLSLDCDYDYQEAVKKIDLLPDNLKPRWIVVNPATNHCHIIWQLKNFITVGQKAERNYRLAKDYLTKPLNGDPSYAGYFVRNPFYKGHTIINISDNTLTLSDLYSYSKANPQKRPVIRKQDMLVPGETIVVSLELSEKHTVLPEKMVMIILLS